MTDDTEEAVSLARRVPWRRLANVVGLVLVLAVVVPFLIYAVPQAVGAEQSYVVLSGSMQPTMNPGDVVVVDDVPAAEIRAGDVITYAESGSDRPTTHRVIEVVEQNGETAFRTQGDNNENADRSLVRPADLEGKVLSVGEYLVVIPLIGHVIQFASTPLGLVALLILPLGALVVSEIWGVVAAASGGTSATAVAATDDDSGDDTEDDGAVDGTVAGPETDGDGATVLETDADGEAVTVEELARSVEEPPDASDTAAADAVESDTAGADAEETDEEAIGGLVFSAAELQLGLVVLVAFFAYSLWVAYATFFEVWAFAVAASVAATLLLLGGLYVVGGEAESTANESQDEHEQEQTGDEDVGEADSSESIPAANRSDGSTGAATETSGADTGASPAVDPDELLSLGEASEVDPQRVGRDPNGTGGELGTDGQRADAVEPPEVSDDD